MFFQWGIDPIPDYSYAFKVKGKIKLGDKEYKPQKITRAKAVKEDKVKNIDNGTQGDDYKMQL